MKPSVAFSYARLATRLTKLYRRRHDSTYTDVFKLKVFVTKRCNLSCIHCGIGAHPPKDNEEIGTDTLARLWEANPDLQLLSFSGGEPFLRHDLSDIAVSAVETLPHLLALSVNTNGWHSDRLLAFTEEVAPRLVVGQRLFMTVSSDGPREQHGIVRRNERSFERKEESLHALRRLGKRLPALQIRHNININPWNFEAIPAYLHELTERREAYFLSFYSAGSHYEHEPQAYEHQQAFRKRLAEDSGWFDSLPAPRSFLGSWYLHLARRYYAQSVPRQPIPCFSSRASLILLPDGRVRPCINYPVDLGRVPQDGVILGDILRSQRAEAVRRIIREQRCANCWTPNEAYPTLMCHAVQPFSWPGTAILRQLARRWVA